MRLLDFRLASHLFKSFHRNKRFTDFISQYHDVRALGDTDRDHACNGVHLMFDLQSEFRETDDIYELETRLMDVLLRMETMGVYVDTQQLQHIGKQLREHSQMLVRQIFADEQPFNLNSAQQLQAFLFDRKGIQPLRKTKTGWSTDEETLKHLAEKYPICAQILEYRHLAKLLNTYVDKLPEHVDGFTGRIHTTYDQAGTTTGRLSSDSPNLQNIPSGDIWSDQVKACFRPQEENWVYVVADYSQVELRILACLSEDQALKDVFHSDLDVHDRTARALFPDAKKISPKQRTQAKSVNFGIMYGITGFGLSKMLPITPTEGKEYIDAFFATYPRVHEYYMHLLEQGRINGYVETYFGRKRWLPGLNDANAMVRQSAEREAINMPIQGTCADIIKQSMIQIDERIQSSGFRSRMIMQVHDELVFEVHREEIPQMSILIQSAMENVVQWDIPLRVQIGVGNNWFEAK